MGAIRVDMPTSACWWKEGRISERVFGAAGMSILGHVRQENRPFNRVLGHAGR
jgi:hypothetical protein